LQPLAGSGADSGAIGVDGQVNDADLALLVERWHKLPPTLRERVMAVLKECDAARDGYPKPALEVHWS
jgi:hypothetical protein